MYRACANVHYDNNLPELNLTTATERAPTRGRPKVTNWVLGFLAGKRVASIAHAIASINQYRLFRP